jgi:hypothetical protein
MLARLYSGTVLYEIGDKCLQRVRKENMDEFNPIPKSKPSWKYIVGENGFVNIYNHYSYICSFICINLADWMGPCYLIRGSRPLNFGIWISDLKARVKAQGLSIADFGF